MKRKLLLADDSVTIQKVVNLTFADEGIDVITVGDGNSAMAKISESAPDVILADVHMPGLSGYQVCEMVRSNEATKELPVVLLVGSFEPFDENEAARVGANAFLTKPFQSIRQLVSQVSDLMQASAATAPASGAPQAMPSAIPVETAGAYEAETPTGYATDTTGEYNVEPTNEFAAPVVDTARPTRPGFRDTTDIDSLYTQSVGGPGQGSAETVPAYVDAGMDDEMIETIHAEPEQQHEEFYQEPTAEYQQAADEDQHETSGYQEANQEFAQPASEYQEPVADYQQPVDEYVAPTTEYHEPVADLQQPVDDYHEPTVEHHAPVAGFQQPVDDYHEEAVEHHAPVAEYQQPVDGYREPTAEYHEPVAGPDQPAESVFEAPIAPSPFDSPAVETPAVSSHTFDETNPLDPYSSTQGIQEAPPTGEFSLDDLNLLELPPIKGQTIEFTNTPEGGKQVVSLSPELMDALVEKVVNKLSNKE